MGGEETAIKAEAGTKKRKADSAPPDGYVCRLCSIPGHWIQVCPTKKTGTKRQRKSDHVPVPGKDPSEEDIEKARELQKIPPPKCFCGLPSRLNKVKRSKEGGDSSRAIGKYFFFCSKKRDDETQCRFARPVEMELNKKKGAGDKTRAKKSDGSDNKKKADSKKPKQICKFYAKNGSCKKGKNCGFSHDVSDRKGPEKGKVRVENQQIRSSARDEKDEDCSGRDDSNRNKDGGNGDKGDKGGEKGDVSSDSDDVSSSDDQSN